MKTMPWRRWAGRALLMVAGPAVFFAGTEIVLFLTGRFEPLRVLERVEHEGREYWATVPEYGEFALRRTDAPRPQEVWVPVEKDAGTLRVVVTGESAAAGFPGSEFSLARVVEALWRERFPERRIEVVNLTMVGVSSHVLRVFVKEAMAMEPDALVLYTGHNEVIGPYGPAARLAGFYPAGWMAQASLAARNTRTGRFLEWAGGRAGEVAGSGMEKWTGLEQFQGARLAWDDAVLEAMAAQTKENVRAMAEVALEAGCKVLVCVPAVNLTDWPPVASAAGGVENSAMAAYGRARELQAEGRMEEAWKFYRRACDLDEMRFRADSRVRGVQREVVAEMGSSDVMLVDADIWLHEGNPGFETDEEFFLEHVHLTFEGRVAVAALMVDGLAELLGVSKNDLEDAREWWEGFPARVEAARERVLFTEFDELGMMRDTEELMAMGLFAGMPDLEERRGRLARRAGELRRSLGEEFDAEGFRARHARAAASNPADPWVDTVAARVFLEAGRVDEAVDMARRAQSKWPNLGYVRLGLCLDAIRGGRLDEALEHLREVERQRRNGEVVAKLYGEIYCKKGEFEAALPYLERHAKGNPGDHFAWENLAMAQKFSGRELEAAGSFRRALALNEGDGQMMNNFAWMLATRQGGTPKERAEAVDLARRAVELNSKAHRFRGTLAVALMEMGRREESQAEAMRAIAMAREAGDGDAVRELEARMGDASAVKNR